MEEYEKIDNELYLSKYVIPLVINEEELWNKIKHNNDLLNWAIQLKKDDSGRLSLNGLAISEHILLDYKNVDSIIYKNLVRKVLKYKDIARIVLDDFGDGNSFLMQTLKIDDFILLDFQKSFVVKEAMNKIGTTLYDDDQNEILRSLYYSNNRRICYFNKKDYLDICNGELDLSYMKYILNKISDSQVHGVAPFDIRYEILRNISWNKEEKQKLVYDFYANIEEYEYCLNEWETSIINDYANYKNSSISLLDKEDLYDYTYDWLLKFYNNEETAKRIWRQIGFCKLMKKLRPINYEKGKTFIKKSQ